MKKKNITAAPALSTERNTLVPVVLTAGTWREGFTDLEYKLLMAEALNFCVATGDFLIKGYLLEKDKIYLVLDLGDTHGHTNSDAYYGQLKEQVGRGILNRQYHPTMQQEAGDLATSDLIFTNKEALSDHLLIRLITGEKVTLSYRNEHFETIKKWVCRSGFCSAIDYGGAVGPVLVRI